ncbi:MAG: pilus assembly PilX N-terminal domain-containing protein [bacterium]|nr:pilus assembly PilX N-terminal domain-containing protein [bacterium]
MIFIQSDKKFWSRPRGVALLFTMLITSIIFAISLGVYNLIIGEITLSGTGRDSQLAFYAADAGAECALYWDIQHPGLGQSAFSTSTPAVISCAGESRSVGGGSVSNFSLSFGNGSCVSVGVEKQPTQNIIIAQGQNTCSGSNRTVQRGLKVVY